MATYDLTINDNATFTTTFLYKDSDGVAINLSGATVKMQIRDTKKSKAYWTGTIGNGITVTAATGRIDIAIPATETKLFSFNSGLYDVVITWANGVKDVLIEGKVLMKAGITQ